jgi:pyruvate/2-oxoglutarate dehydrogenase complex dihydrolipoamide acyltransferase (E2) component
MVKVGDTVALRAVLITVEGDKASMEVPAPFGGYRERDQDQHRRQSVAP